MDPSSDKGQKDGLWSMPDPSLGELPRTPPFRPQRFFKEFWKGAISLAVSTGQWLVGHKRDINLIV